MQALGRQLAGPDAAGSSGPVCRYRSFPRGRTGVLPPPPFFLCKSLRHGPMTGSCRPCAPFRYAASSPPAVRAPGPAPLPPDPGIERARANPHTLRRWTAGVRPTAQHMMALLGLADSFGLGHLLTANDDRRGGGSGR